VSPIREFDASAKGEIGNLNSFRSS
jgi:hypothetical protein